MCGIFGSIGFELPASLVRRALWSLRHRGPDDWGVWASDLSGDRRARLLPELERGPWNVDNREDNWGALPTLPVVLGHARLSVLDVSRCGHQPMELDGAVLVFNGEIYNYRELRPELESLGHPFHGTGDAEVLLAACRTWGAAAIPRLNGAFAFGLWDSRTGELLLVRDRLGKKPLYWTGNRDGLAFASEIKALWEAGLAGSALEPGVAVRYLALGSLPSGDESFFAGVRQVPPGSFLRWRPGSAPEIRKYWEPAMTFDRRPADAPARLRELLAESVRLRYRSDVPVGLSLSGGIDSSALLVSSVEAGERVLSFSGVHETGIGDERDRIQQVLARYPQVDAAFLPTSEGSGYGDFLEFLALHDEPLKSDGIYNQYRFLRELRKRGIKVLLSGQGADELFLGYPWYLRPYLRWLVRSLDPSAMRWAAELRRREGGSWIGLARGLASEMSPARLESFKRRQAMRWLRGDAWQDACAGPFRRSLALGASWPDFHAAQLQSESLPALLKDEDRNSMANGIETRLPYLDVHLVEWAATLAPDVSLRGGSTKRVLREAFADRLPHEIVWSPAKRGFYVPYLERWPEHGDHARRLLREADWLDGWIRRSDLEALAASGRLDRGLQWRAFNLAFAERNARERRTAPVAKVA